MSVLKNLMRSDEMCVGGESLSRIETYASRATSSSTVASPKPDELCLRSLEICNHGRRYAKHRILTHLIQRMYDLLPSFAFNASSYETDKEREQAQACFGTGTL
jgi:hypothetical protein